MKCFNCGTTKNLIKWAKPNNKQYYTCRECNTKRAKEYRQTKNGIEATRKAVRVYESKNHKRKLAWGLAHKLPNKPCIKCGKWGLRHHPDINKPLEIIYLCPLHHKQEHRRMLL